MIVFKNFIKNVENHKIYNLIVISTLLFIVLALESFYHISVELKNLSVQNRILVIKDMQHTTSSWLLERISSIDNGVKYLNGYYNDEEKVRGFSEFFADNYAKFDAIQILVPGRYFYINDKKMDDYVQGYTLSEGYKRYFEKDEKLWYFNQKWYQDVRRDRKTIIGKVVNHEFLNETTINICTPIINKQVFKGVLCGIIKATNLFDRIKSLRIPPNTYYFISDKEGDILTSFGKIDISQDEIKKIMSLGEDDKERNFYMQESLVTIDRFEDFDWYIAVGIDSWDTNNRAMGVFVKRTSLVFLFFIIFVFAINSAYSFLHRRVDAKRKEYERALEYRSRMSEIGELVAGINHQLRQPLNSFALIVSNTLKLSKNKTLDKKTLEGNLKLSLKTVTHMDKTIDIFRNFYRYNDAATEFSLQECIESVLYVTYTELSKESISIEARYEKIKDLKIISIENFIQQVLLVLIHNAKEAILPLQGVKDIERRRIVIDFEVSEESVFVDVSDFGGGIKKETAKNIFSSLKHSNKKRGFGMGLYFAKKLAKERLMGDLTLIGNYCPTTFRIKIKRDIKG